MGALELKSPVRRVQCPMGMGLHWYPHNALPERKCGLSTNTVMDPEGWQLGLSVSQLCALHQEVWEAHFYGHYTGSILKVLFMYQSLNFGDTPMKVITSIITSIFQGIGRLSNLSKIPVTGLGCEPNQSGLRDCEFNHYIIFSHNIPCGES